MKTKDGFSQFELLRLRWQSTALLLFKPVFKTICSHSWIKKRTTAKVLAGLVALNMMAGVALAQVARNNWIGSTDSNWFLGKNWSSGPDPDPAGASLPFLEALPVSLLRRSRRSLPNWLLEAAQLIVENNPSFPVSRFTDH